MDLELFPAWLRPIEPMIKAKPRLVIGPLHIDGASPWKPARKKPMTRKERVRARLYQRQRRAERMARGLNSKGKMRTKTL